ncbi:MAG: SH3 domain-containing protein [Hyphomicrobiaceae bacterium]
MDGRSATAAANSDLPKFFSLKSNPVNLRKGPGTKYPKAWVFRREGLPVEVLREHGRWRQVRDSDGATGWILRTLMSSRRTALVTPWHLKDTAQSGRQLTTMYASARFRSRRVAKLEAGALVSLRSCDGRWCYVSIGRFRGYVKQDRLWGIYPQEVLR